MNGERPPGPESGSVDNEQGLEIQAYNFGEIISPEQYLVYEHFREFRLKYGDINHNRVSAAFEALTFPRYAKPLLGQNTRLNPSDLGLIVANRETVGLPKGKFRFSPAEAIQVGGFINFVEYKMLTVDLYALRQPTQLFFKAMSDQLKTHLVETEDMSRYL